MTNAEKFKQIFGLYATELWAKPESEFLKWLQNEYKNMPQSRLYNTFDSPMWEFTCRKCGKAYLKETATHYDEALNIHYWTSICPECGTENEVNDCYWR